MIKTISLMDRCRNLTDQLAVEIIGQDEVLPKFSEAVKHGYCRLNTPGRPRGTLFLLGPTGTGKTEIVEAAARCLYGREDNHLLRLDMSEFSRQAGEEALTNLIGMPGSRESGRLQQFLDRHREGIILYDEIEKAHPEIFTILLQQLDSARITLHNQTYDLSDFFIIGTSNIGGQIFQNIKHLSAKRLKQTLEFQLKQRFSPEFVARWGAFDHEILLFRPLLPAHLRLISRKFFSSILPQYARYGLRISLFSADVVEESLKSIDNTRNGARELRGAIERMVKRCIYRTLSSPDFDQHSAGGYILDLDRNNELTLLDAELPKEYFHVHR